MLLLFFFFSFNHNRYDCEFVGNAVLDERVKSFFRLHQKVESRSKAEKFLVPNQNFQPKFFSRLNNFEGISQKNYFSSLLLKDTAFPCNFFFPMIPRDVNRFFKKLHFQEFDECALSDHGCEHDCINTLGGYECSCRIGYELHSDGKHCEGE